MSYLYTTNGKENKKARVKRTRTEAERKKKYSKDTTAIYLENERKQIAGVDGVHTRHNQDVLSGHE